jgi:hypothetical protein
MAQAEIVDSEDITNTCAEECPGPTRHVPEDERALLRRLRGDPDESRERLAGGDYRSLL